MLKWRRLSAGGCWEISLTMRWLRRTHTLKHTRTSSPVEALFPLLPQFSHIIWIHLNVVWLKPISLHQKCLRWMEDLTATTSMGPHQRGHGPLWVLFGRFDTGSDGHSVHLWRTRGWNWIFECLLLFNLRCSGCGHGCSCMYVCSMFAPTLDHSSQRALCVSPSGSTLNNCIYEMGWCHYNHHKRSCMNVLFFLVWNLAD